MPSRRRLPLAASSNANRRKRAIQQERKRSLTSDSPDDLVHCLSHSPAPKSGSTECTAAAMLLVWSSGSPFVRTAMWAWGHGICQNGMSISGKLRREDRRYEKHRGTRPTIWPLDRRPIVVEPGTGAPLPGRLRERVTPFKNRFANASFTTATRDVARHVLLGEGAPFCDLNPNVWKYPG